MHFLKCIFQFDLQMAALQKIYAKVSEVDASTADSWQKSEEQRTATAAALTRNRELKLASSRQAAAVAALMAALGEVRSSPPGSPVKRTSMR